MALWLDHIVYWFNRPDQEVCVCVYRLTDNHEHKVDVQEVGELNRRADEFSEVEAEQLSLVKDGNGLDDSYGCIWRKRRKS